MRTSKEKLTAVTKLSIGNCDIVEIIGFSNIEGQTYAIAMCSNGLMEEFKIDDLENVGYEPIDLN